MSSRTLLAILGLASEKREVDDVVRELAIATDGGAKAVAPDARAARVRAADSFML